MDLTVSFYVVAAISILITGISKSGFGGGLGVMSVPLMSLFTSPQFAAAVMMPILLTMDVLIVWRYRRSWNRQVVLALLPAALIGLGLGAFMFQSLEADMVRLAIGVLALAFVAQFLLQGRFDPGTRQTPRPMVWALGTLSGFASFIAHAGGPPVKGYLLRQNMDKTTFVGTNTVFFFALNSIKTVAYGAAGTLTADSLRTSAMLAPLLFAGVALGLWLHRFVDQAVFVRIVYGFLALTGIRLLYDSLPGFL